MSRTSLTRYAPQMRDPDPAGARIKAGEMWARQGIVVLFPDQLNQMAGLERELIQAVAAKHYGKRK
jgi:hypothetical protein